MTRISRHVLFFFAAIVVINVLLHKVCSATEDDGMKFYISKFEVTGSTVFPVDGLQEILAPFIGAKKTVDDVEDARDAIEKLYHDAGYPAVIVNIPEQTLEDNVVRLEVMENRIGQVKVTGNRYFTMNKMMRDLPSLRQGQIIYLPDVQRDIARMNRNPDFKVNPVMSPGKIVGTIDIELQVKDSLPLYGYLELNNRSSHDTTQLRSNVMIRYDNLWQKEHSLSFQYQTAPLETKEVQVISTTYVLPSPWNVDQQLAFYAIWSDSDVAFGEGFSVIGSGKIFGIRYVIPLPRYKFYSHNITIGIDYKSFDETVGFTKENGESTKTPVSYLPLSLSYASSLPDKWGGTTRFIGGLNLSLRGIVSRQSEFELKRFKAQANYLYATAEIERSQKLPLGMSLFARVGGQLANQPLINNEQYTAGGMDSVRGYKESEALGDNAVHSRLEVAFSDPLNKVGIGKWAQMEPLFFYDATKLFIKKPLRNPDGSITSSIMLEGLGAGVRGSVTKTLDYELDWAIALKSTDRIENGDQRFNFIVRAMF